MLRFFIVCLIAGMMFPACSSDEWMDGKEEAMGTKQLIRLTLKLALPVDDVLLSDYSGNKEPVYDGRVNYIMPDKEEGTEAESVVRNALVVLGRIADGALSPVVIHNVHEIEGFKSTGNIAQWIGYLNEVPGLYRMIVIANPLPGMRDWQSFQKGNDWMAFLHQGVGLPNNDYIQRQKENIWNDNHFMMTNAFGCNVSEYEVELRQKNDNVKSVSVQRVCARFDYKANRSDNVYIFPEGQKYYGLRTLVGGNIVEKKVKIRMCLTEAALMNLSRSFHLLKMFSPDEMAYYPTPHEKETGDNYVVDVDWTEKREHTSLTEDRLNEMFYFSSERKNPSADGKLQYVNLPAGSDYGRLFYASENTIPGVNNQINMLSTGVVFKGEFIVLDENDKEISSEMGDLFFYKEGTEYYLADSREVVCRDLGLTETDVNTDSALALHRINRYTKDMGRGKYQVWYTYWNRHFDNKDPYKMGIMEFAVVRNNVYKLDVRSINILGNPMDPSDPKNPWKPDGNTPNEKMPELDVAFEVCEWRTREIIYEI